MLACESSVEVIVQFAISVQEHAKGILQRNGIFITRRGQFTVSMANPEDELAPRRQFQTQPWTSIHAGRGQSHRRRAS